MEGIKRGDFDKCRKEIRLNKPANKESKWGELRNQDELSLISDDKTGIYVS
jgi:hypothetical protein